MFPTVIKVFNGWLLLALTFFQFWFPAFALLTLIPKRRLPKDAFLLPVSAVIAGALGYFAFWAYFLHHAVGKVFSFAILSFAVWASLKNRKTLQGFWKLHEVKVPLLLMVSVFLFYNGLLLRQKPADLGPNAATHSLQWELPNDNILPFLIASAFFNGEDPRDARAQWRTSDRPPLQSGIALVPYPLYFLFTQAQGYHWVSSFAQCLWVVACYSLFAALGLNPSQRLWGILLLVVSGFHWINTVYTWPKMLSASYFLIGILLWLTDKTSRSTLILGAIAFTLAFLSHGGAVFAFLGAFLVYIGTARLRSRFTVKELSLALGIFVINLLPWSLYQKFYDPPGTLLIKCHLAGVSQNDSRGVFTTIREAYAPLSLSDVMSRFYLNLKSLTPWGWLPWKFPVSEWPNLIRQGDFFYLTFELGLLLLGIAVLLARTGRKVARCRGLALADDLLLTCLLGIIVWCALMFEAGSTVLHQGSYVFPLTLAVLGRAIIVELGKGLTAAVFTVRALSFLFAYLAFPAPSVPPEGIVPLLGFSGLGVAFIVYTFKITPAKS